MFNYFDNLHLFSKMWLPNWMNEVHIDRSVLVGNSNFELQSLKLIIDHDHVNLHN